MQVIPVINCDFKDDECVLGKINKIGNASNWVHLDVGDGVFTFNKSWNEPDKWRDFNKNNLNLEVHLMVENPIDQIKKWLDAGAKRIIFHLEALEGDKNEMISKILDLGNNYGAQIIISICPETPTHELEPFLNKFNYFQLLAVYPGPAGQKFLWPVLDKIKLLKKLKPEAVIEVDGGINLEVAKKCKEAGADILVSGTYIFSSNSVKEGIENLESVA
jgi:ribulose-phosphate 3-epimerase